MKISAIKQQERLKGRYSVFVDDTYTFSLSENALLDQKLYNGMEIDALQIERYKKLSADDKAYGLTLAYVARRPRSEWELTDYFRRKSYDEEVSKEILERLRGLGLVDDEKFARSWVENRRLLKPISKRKLHLELRAKRISDSVIALVFAEDETNELDTLHQMVVKKRRQSKYQDNMKLMQYLAGQGFGYSDIKQVIEETSDE